MQSDGMMYYCGSGYKYNHGKRLDFSSSKEVARVAHVGDRMGLLVDSRMSHPADLASEVALKIS
jgi:hypothetical protein